MTRETVEKLSEVQRSRIEMFRKLRKIYEKNDSDRYLDMLRIERNAYIKGLRDAGAITERERQVLSIYMTV